jgi:hypothetical protein
MAAAEQAPLPMDVLRYRKDREVKVREENEMWLERHPEVGHLLHDFMCAVLAEQPNDIFSFARTHFRTPMAQAATTDSLLDDSEPAPAELAVSAPAAVELQDALEGEEAGSEDASTEAEDEPAPAAGEEGSEAEDSIAAAEGWLGVENETSPLGEEENVLAAAEDTGAGEEESAAAPWPPAAEVAAELASEEAPSQ